MQKRRVARCYVDSVDTMSVSPVLCKPDDLTIQYCMLYDSTMGMWEQIRSHVKRIVTLSLLLLAIMAIAGCATAYRFVLSDEVPNAKYYDGRVVQTSIGSSSAVEMTVRPDRRALIVDLYIQN